MPSFQAEREAAKRRRTLAADPQMQALIAAALSDSELKQDLEAWLAQLFLLAPVPFSTIVVNASMLPAESLRFFYIDPNWLKALFDGAVSIGAGTPQHQQSLQQALGDLEQGALDEAGYGTATACGFLLRSGVIAAYPRLVFTGYADTQGTQRVAPLRLDTLSSNFVIGIYPQPLARLDIAEPPEGMQFGFEPDDNNNLMLNLRYLTGTGTTPGSEIVISGVKAQLNVAPYIGRAGDTTGTVVDVAGLQAALQQQLITLKQLPANGTLGPGDFATQMVAAPETQIFNLQASSNPRGA